MIKLLKTIVKILKVISLCGLIFFGACTIILIISGEIAGVPLFLYVTFLFWVLFMCSKFLSKLLSEEFPKQPVLRMSDEIVVVCENCGAPQKIKRYASKLCSYCDMPIKGK